MKTPSLVLRLKASLQGPEAWAPGLEQVQGKGPNISTSQCPFCRAPRSVLLWGKWGPIIMHLSVGCQWASFWVVSLHLETQTICQLLGSLFGLQLLKWTVYTIHKCTTSWIQNREIQSFCRIECFWGLRCFDVIYHFDNSNLSFYWSAFSKTSSTYQVFSGLLLQKGSRLL